MSRELKRDEIVFDDIIEEISTLVFGRYYEDEDGNYWDNCCDEDDEYEDIGYHENKLIQHIDKVFESGGPDEYLFMKYIFKYKDKYYSIICNENSYGDSGFETDTLEEVKPKQKTITVYE